MLTGVQTITSVVTTAGQWQDNWDTTGLTSTYTNLPSAVRVDIQMAQPEGQQQQPGADCTGRAD